MTSAEMDSTAARVTRATCQSALCAKLVSSACSGSIAVFFILLTAVEHGLIEPTLEVA